MNSFFRTPRRQARVGPAVSLPLETFTELPYLPDECECEASGQVVLIPIPLAGKPLLQNPERFKGHGGVPPSLASTVRSPACGRGGMEGILL
mmetsp:Transcript_5347/g.18884  ORF Transcript_5347/g.18884 Transcript_5347/m.18884 type:complete len:92 (+) Transcript_5347:1424-1699(+)